MKLIDKDALVAEIEDKINKYTKRGEESDAKRDGYGMFWGGVLSCLNEVRTLCDTLEVKEVDLNEHQISDIIQNLFPTDQFIESETLLLSRKEAILFAKHFFELGLKAQKGE